MGSVMQADAMMCAEKSHKRAGGAWLQGGPAGSLHELGKEYGIHTGSVPWERRASVEQPHDMMELLGLENKLLFLITVSTAALSHDGGQVNHCVKAPCPPHP